MYNPFARFVCRWWSVGTVLIYCAAWGLVGAFDVSRQAAFGWLGIVGFVWAGCTVGVLGLISLNMRASAQAKREVEDSCARAFAGTLITALCCIAPILSHEPLPVVVFGAISLFATIAICRGSVEKMLSTGTSWLPAEIATPVALLVGWQFYIHDHVIFAFIAMGIVMWVRLFMVSRSLATPEVLGA